MCWNKMPAWLKGGIISLAIVAVLYLLSEYLLPNPTPGVGFAPSFSLFSVFFVLTGFPVIILIGMLSSLPGIDDIVAYTAGKVFFIIVYYFALGALIGWIITSFKRFLAKRKEQTK